MPAIRWRQIESAASGRRASNSQGKKTDDLPVPTS
jgi:hypothetical protein